MRRFVSHVLLAACLVLLASGDGVAADASPPNLLVIVIDAQRADHLSSYGYGRPTSPGLDAFFARGVRFVGWKQSRCHVAVDLVQLIEIDRAFAARARRGGRRPAAERPQHGEHRRERHQREYKPQGHRDSGTGFFEAFQSATRRVTP